MQGSKSYDLIYKDNEKYTCHYSKSIYYPVWQEAVRHIEGRVLELGCGTGQFAQMLNETKKPMYLGVDYSQEAIRQAKERCPDLNFLCENVFKVIVPIADAIVALELLEHIKDDMLLISKLPKGKLIVFSVPDFESDNHYRTFKTPEEIKKRYKKIDIKIIKEFKFIKNELETSTIFLCVGRKR